MQICFLSIGKDNDQYVSNGIAAFTERISHYHGAEWKLIPPLKNAGSFSQQELKSKEADLVLKHIKKDAFLVALDEKGKMLNSVKLAEFIQIKADSSLKQLAFLIGGAYGLDEKILQQAGLIWSLSALTFPHQLVRLILAEQVYRACTIARNEKYHHA